MFFILEPFRRETEVSDVELTLVDPEVCRLDVSMNAVAGTMKLLYDLNHLYGDFLNLTISNLSFGELADEVLEVFLEILHDQVSATALNVVLIILRGAWKLIAIAVVSHEEALVKDLVLPSAVELDRDWSVVFHSCIETHVTFTAFCEEFYELELTMHQYCRVPAHLLLFLNHLV